MALEGHWRFSGLWRLTGGLVALEGHGRFSGRGYNAMKVGVSVEWSGVGGAERGRCCVFFHSSGDI
jgi:hypothetical protein